MYLISFIQPTDDWSNLWVQKAFIFELFLLAFSYPLVTLCIYLLFHTKQYHPNLSIMLRHIFIQYPFQMVARITLIVKMLTEDNDKMKTDIIFMLASCLRTYLIFLAFYFSLFAMVERSFATYYLKDYESHQRKYIGWLLTTLLHLVSYTSASLFVFEIISVWPILFSITLSNLAAFIMCHTNSFLNKKKLKDMVLSKCTCQAYSLSERYQLAENIAVATLFKKGIVLFIFFSLVCCSFMSAEEIDDDVYLRNWMHVSFNFAAAIYGIAVPLALFHYNEEWRAGAKKLWAKVSRCHDITPNADPTRDSIATAQKATELYFAQLAKDWTPRG